MTEPLWTPEEALAIGNLARPREDLADAVRDVFPDNKLAEVAERVCEGYAEDKASRKEWEDSVHRAYRSVQTSGRISSDSAEARSNVRHPATVQAVLEFGARAKSALIQDRQVAKGRKIGADPASAKAQRAGRVGRFMSDQLVRQSPSYIPETDKLTHNLPLAGHCFRKCTWDRERRIPQGEFIPGLQVVVHQDTTAFQECPRITQTYTRYPYQILEGINDGRYADVDLTRWTDGDELHTPIDILESHIRLDLDGDGYPEPWVAVIMRETRDVLAVTPNYRPEGIERAPGRGMIDPRTGQLAEYPGDIIRIQPWMHFVDYIFVPDLEGKYYGWGFGRILEHLQAVIDTSLNEILDAGAMHNANGGFLGQEINLGSRGAGPQRFDVREWHNVQASGDDLRRAIVPFPKTEPSMVLFQMLGLMVEEAAKTSGAADVLSGDAPRGQAMGTTLALIEQGLQKFSSIMERIQWSMGQELKVFYALNRDNLRDEDYQRVLDEIEQPQPGIGHNGGPPMGPQQASGPPRVHTVAEDFADDSDIEPVVDPRHVTEMQRLTRAQIPLQHLGHPLSNDAEALKHFYEAAGLEDPARFLKAPQPDIAGMMKAAAEVEERKAKAAAIYVDMIQTAADALKKIAEAEAVEAGPQIEAYKTQLAAMVPFIQQIGSVFGDQRGAGVGHDSQSPFGPGGPSRGGMAGVVGPPAGPSLPQSPGIPDVGGEAPLASPAQNGAAGGPIGPVAT